MTSAGGIQTLHRAALRLQARGKRRFGGAKRLPALIFMTDPVRTTDPEAVAERLPRGSAIVFRAFGASDAVRQGRALARIARRRGLLLLAGADPALARAIGAQGVHLPERRSCVAGALKRGRPGWLVTAAAHGEAAARRALAAGADAVLVSPVFESRSPSAGRPLGPVRFAALVGRAGGPVYALGGVKATTAARLIGTGAAGLAAVEALLKP
ncbi:MAG TPA: thiamine phosphate synthase [Caulobacteraceae bacterium]